MTIDTLVESFDVEVDGVEGKDRPRFRVAGQGKKQFVQVYSTAKTQAAEKRVQEAWRLVGSPTVESPIEVNLTLHVARPAGHYTSKGALSAEGQRHPYPTGRKPDVDNALKLVMDALNGHAYRDDVDVIVATVRRVWLEAGVERTCARVGTWHGVE